MLVFVHGAGRSGADAWPAVDREDAVILDLASCRTVEDQVAAVTSAVTRPAVLVAHSYGAIPAVLALRTISHRVIALVLSEPALFDVARGNAVIERYIGQMGDALRAYEEDSLESYWRIVRPLMFGGPFDQARWADEQGLAQRFVRIRPPWGFGISIVDLSRTRTIVVTGDWNVEYDVIAAALVAAGAEHRVLAGARHRPQDLPGFADVLADAVRY